MALSRFANVAALRLCAGATVVVEIPAAAARDPGLMAAVDAAVQRMVAHRLRVVVRGDRARARFGRRP